MKYRVKIIETLSMTVEVEAPSAEEAIDQVEQKYWDEEIVVASRIKPKVKFLVVSPV